MDPPANGYFPAAFQSFPGFNDQFVIKSLIQNIHLRGHLAQ